MAYTYKKLSEVELVETSTAPNLLIEDEGDIKKISASNIAVPQVKADWEESDPDSPAFILNKPETLSGANVVTYSVVSGALLLNDIAITPQELINEWNNGSILRVRPEGWIDNRESVVSNISYTVQSGVAVGATVSYVLGTAIYEHSIS